MTTNLLTSIVSIMVSVLAIVGTYKIFQKAGEKGWKAIIPGYSSYIRYKLTWNTKYFWTMLGLAMIFAVSSTFEKGATGALHTALALAVIISGIAVIAFKVKEAQKLSKAFNKSGWFTAGLFFLEPIFNIILGFDKSEYVNNTCVNAEC